MSDTNPVENPEVETPPVVNNTNSPEAVENNNSTASPFLGDLTDGRQPGDWKSRYSDPEAKNAIRYEKNYLMILVVTNLFVLALFGIIVKSNPQNIYCLSTKKYVFGFLGGVLGGCVFSCKWLIHSVAKNTWNRDRRLWRIFTPIVSGILGLIFILLLCTDIISNNTDSMTVYKAFGIAFLVGYFSDNAIGKLTEIAQVFFGSTNRK